MDPVLAVVFRWLHVIFAALAVGGVFFMRVVLPAGIRHLDDPGADRQDGVLRQLGVGDGPGPEQVEIVGGDALEKAGEVAPAGFANVGRHQVPWEKNRCSAATANVATPGQSARGGRVWGRLRGCVGDRFARGEPWGDGMAQGLAPCVECPSPNAHALRPVPCAACPAPLLPAPGPPRISAEWTTAYKSVDSC